MSPNLDTTPTIVYRVEQSGEHAEYYIGDCNQAALSLFHTTRAKFIGRNVHDFIRGPEFNQLATWRGDILQQRADLDELTTIAYEFQRDDGTIFTAEVLTRRASMSMLLRPMEE